VRAEKLILFMGAEKLHIVLSREAL